ncbi:MAG: hypothetical protein AABY64_13575 [Bdellovibrionota bacterium]
MYEIELEKALTGTQQESIVLGKKQKIEIAIKKGTLDNTNFNSIINEIDSLFPLRSVSGLFQEIKLSNIKFDFSIILSDALKNIALVFDNCTFFELTKKSYAPLIMRGGQSKIITIESHPANVELKGHVVESLELKEQYGASCLKISDDCKLTNFNFTGSRAGDIIVNSSIITNLEFRDIVIADTDFTNITFKNSPNFMKSKLEKTVTFFNCEFEEFSKESAIKYRDLKKHMQENHDDGTALVFGALELKSIDAFTRFTDQPADWISNKVYKSINDFGLRVYRPLFLLVLLFLLMDIIFAEFAERGWIYISLSESLNGHKYSFVEQAFLLALTSALSPFRLLGKIDIVNPTHLYGQLLYWGLSVLSSILWFFFFLGIRKKYKIN